MNICHHKAAWGEQMGQWGIHCIRDSSQLTIVTNSSHNDARQLKEAILEEVVLKNATWAVEDHDQDMDEQSH